MFIAVFIFALPLMTAWGAEGTPIGGEPYERWEDGGNDFFVMFNSLIDDQVTLSGETTNRQADTCILESSFTLNGIHSPDDAIVSKAYLVWMGAVDPASFEAPTDNAVHLKFVRADEKYTYETDVIAGDTAKNLLDTSNPFEFQSVKFNTDVTTGCSESNAGQSGTGDVAYFTYRKDISDFFKKIYDDNLASTETVLKDGEALYGTYTVSGLDCTNHDNYKCRTTMVSNWSIFFVYKSGKTRSKKIYLYPGFAYAQGETSVANVSGFDLPKNPVLRLTTMIAEGDPALVKPQLPPELIYIKGADATSTYNLTNTCNPLVDMSYEIYNSNSSIYGWDPDDEQIFCVSGGIEGQYYGIDADTFLLDSEDDVNLQEHLKLGGTGLDVTLSVNQDAILMNYLILSVDTKAPAFDIPPEAIDWPEDREKHYCSCRNSEDDPNAWCQDRPMYYLVKVQNWGANIANNVTVVDELSPLVDYIPGTTEIATTFKDNGRGDGTDWTKIEDKQGTGNAAFPLSGEGYKVADTMDTCNQATWTCTDTRMLRFKVKPKPGISKTAVIPNLAIIKEAGSAESAWYKSNRNFELKLRKGTCVEVATCEEPKQVDCGGIAVNHECDVDADCNKDGKQGYVCDNETDTQYTENEFTCKPDEKITCNNAKVSFDIAINSPDSEGTRIIVPAPTDDLVLGQFMINAENCLQTKFYGFVSLRLKLEKDDNNITLKDIELIHDKDGSGTADPGEEVVALTPELDSTGVYFNLADDKNRFAGNEKHFFIIRADVGYLSTEIKGGAWFHFMIENKDSFTFEDAGTPKPDGNPITFADFLIEPTSDYFIVTKGANDPAVPAPSELNQDIPVLQLRTKALDESNRIRRIIVSIPSSGDYIRFGKNGIRSVSLYRDTDGNGQLDPNIADEKTPIAKISSFEDDGEAIFEGDTLESVLDFDAGEEMFLIVKADLTKLGDTAKAKIEIKKGGVMIQNATVKVEGLPVASKEFYASDVPETDSDVVTKDPDPCDCSMIAGSADIDLSLAVLLLSAMAFIFARRPRRES